MQRLGIFGGTFNPPHWGHLRVAIAALQQFQLDQVLWVPSQSPHHRQNEPPVDFVHRLEMVKRAIVPYPKFSLALGETSHNDTSFAIDTLTCLQASYPNSKWFWVIGLDAFQTLPRWYQREILIPRCTWLVAPRLTPGKQVSENLTTPSEVLESPIEEKISPASTAQATVTSVPFAPLNAANEDTASGRKTANPVHSNQWHGDDWRWIDEANLEHANLVPSVEHEWVKERNPEPTTLLAEAIAHTIQQCLKVEADLQNQQIKVRWQVFSLLPVPISSRQIRQLLQTPSSISSGGNSGLTSADQKTAPDLKNLVPPEVEDYIAHQHLYLSRN